MPDLQGHSDYYLQSDAQDPQYKAVGLNDRDHLPQKGTTSLSVDVPVPE